MSGCGFVIGREWRGPGEAQRLTDEGQLRARLSNQQHESERRGTPLTDAEREYIKLSIREIENTMMAQGEKSWAGWTSRRGLPGDSPEGRRQIEEDYLGRIETFRARLGAGVYP